MDRPGLARLCETLADYDVLLVWRTDRVARSLVHFSSVIEMCDAAGVRLVSVQDGWDVHTPHGRFAAHVLASFAQFERELCRERQVSSQNHLRKSGRWTGGRVPYGLRAIPHQDGKGKVLMRDESAVPVVRELAERIMEGEAPTRIAADLQARGVAPPRVHNSSSATPVPSSWSHKSIKIVMTSVTLLGHRLEHRTGKVICDESGPVRYWEPILSEAEFARVAEAFAATYRPRSPNRPTYWLHGVVVCGVCGGSLKRSESSGAETLRCLGTLKEPHSGVSIKTEDFEEWFEGDLRRRLGGAYVVDHRHHAEVELRGEIVRLRRYLDELIDDRRAGVFATPEAVAVFRREYETTARALADCERQPHVPGSWEVQETSCPMWVAWARWTPEERGSYLLGCSVKAVIGRPPRPRARVAPKERGMVELGDLAQFDAEAAGSAAGIGLRHGSERV